MIAFKLELEIKYNNRIHYNVSGILTNTIWEITIISIQGIYLNTSYIIVMFFFFSQVLFNEPIFQWTLISPEEKQILAGLSPGLTLPLVEVIQAIDA